MQTTIAEITVSYKPVISPHIEIKDSVSAATLFRTLISSATISLREEAVCLYLNRANRVLGWYRVSFGGITGTVVDIRLILGVALKTVSCGLVLCHNHPSGNPKPSEADQALTRKLREAAGLMDIKVLDHLIVTDEGYFSFADEGIL